jgi:ribosomal protein S27AE
MDPTAEHSHIQDIVNLPCPSCGSQLTYSAKHKKLRCGHCGYTEAVDNSNDKVVEQELRDKAQLALEFIPEKVGKKVFDCGNCGAKFMVESDKVRVKCGFCGSTNVNLEAYEHQYIQPVGIIPFYISRDEAVQLFQGWIKQGWFHPNKLKKLANLEDLHGIYIPCWTFDAQTQSQWSGQAGFYYYETRMVRVNGKMQPQQVQKVRWVFRSGELQHFFDDILVVASGGLKQRQLEQILPYRLEEVVNFDPRLLLGWESEIYSLEVDKGYQVADQIMDSKIRNMCSAQLGGDTQRNLRISSRKWDQTFKHIILPIWISSYTYNGKQYHFTINGQTGKVNGQKPLSWIKILILVLAFALFIFGIYWLKESGLLQG